MKKTLFILLLFFSMINTINCVDLNEKPDSCMYKNKLSGKMFELYVYENGEVFATNEYYPIFERLDKQECPQTLYFDSKTAEGKKNLSLTKDDEIYKYEAELQFVHSDSIAISQSPRRKLNCGNITGIPIKFPELTSYAVKLIQVAVPIILVILGSIDLFKGITAGKEDEMKKGQQMFIKRLITAALIFFVVVIVKILASLVANSITTANIVDCIDCFVNYDCSIYKE